MWQHRASMRLVVLRFWPGVLITFSVIGFITSTIGQTVFLNLNAPGQYASNFNPWNDSTGVNAGNYDFAEGTTSGVNGGGGVSVFQSTDTTATYNGSGWDFSTNGAALIVSTLVKANGQVSANKVHLGFLNSVTNGLNNNSGVAFESFRFVPVNATNWSAREQYKIATGSAVETNLGTNRIVVGHWYKFVVGLTNIGGAAGNYTAGCALYDY